MNTKRRIVRRAITRVSDSVPKKKGKFVLKVKCQSYVGWHSVGESGTFLSQGNGLGNFFPDRGGVIVNLPCASVENTAQRKERSSSPVPAALAAAGIPFTWKSAQSSKAKVASSCKTRTVTKTRLILRK
jgi:hypothetical protein